MKYEADMWNAYAKGYEEGLALGRAEVIREQKEAIALRMHRYRFPVSLIMEATELSEEEIRRIIANDCEVDRKSNV